MGTWIAEQITCKLIASSVIEEGDRELYSYGFFLLISKIFFFFVAVIAGLLTDTTVESIIFYVVRGWIRTRGRRNSCKNGDVLHCTNNVGVDCFCAGDKATGNAYQWGDFSAHVRNWKSLYPCIQSTGYRRKAS